MTGTDPGATLASVTDAADPSASPDVVTVDPARATEPRPLGQQGAPESTGDAPDEETVEAPPGAGEAVSAPATAGTNDQIVVVKTDANGCGIVNLGVLLAHVTGTDAVGLGSGTIGVSEAAVGITRFSVSDGPPNAEVTITVHLPN